MRVSPLPQFKALVTRQPAINRPAQPGRPAMDTFVRFGDETSDEEKMFEKKLTDGTRAFQRGDFATAYRAYLGAREWSHPNNLTQTIQALHSLGSTCTELRMYDEGIRHLSEGIRLVDTKMPSGRLKLETLAGLQNDLGQLYYRKGDSADAESVLEAGYMNVLKANNGKVNDLPASDRYWAEINQTLGYIAEHLDNYEKATTHYEAALEFQERHNMTPYNQFHNLTMLARFYFYEAGSYKTGGAFHTLLKEKQENYLRRAENKVPELVAMFPNDPAIAERIAELNDTLILVGRTAQHRPAS